MPTRKIAEPQTETSRTCNHPDHRPPSHQVFEPGTYEHVCAGCGHKTIFTVPLITL